AAERFDRARVVLRAVPRRDLRVAPAVILNQLATAIDERLQVRVERIDGVAVHRFRARDVGTAIEHRHVPARISEDEEAEVIEPGRPSRGGPPEVGPSELAAW